MELWEYDLPTIGVLCRHIRRSWTDKEPVDIAKACSFSDSAISRFENGLSHLGKPRFNCYLETVQALCPRRLTIQQREILRHLYTDSKEIKKRQEELAAIDLEFIKSVSRPETLKNLVNDLGNVDYPAFIMDALWHIHAVNGPLLRLFSIDPDSESLKHWWFWHVLASKFHPKSPVRQAHHQPGEYFEHAIDQFFQNPYTNRFLFTVQTRHLLHKINAFSEPNDFDFAQHWHGAFTFNLRYKTNPFRRLLWYKDNQGNEKIIKAVSVPQEHHEVELAPGYDAFYILAAWYPQDVEARMAFDEVSRTTSRGVKTLFATDFSDGTFHVNSWSEVQAKVPILQS